MNKKQTIMLGALLSLGIASQSTQAMYVSGPALDRMAQAAERAEQARKVAPVEAVAQGAANVPAQVVTVAKEAPTVPAKTMASYVSPAIKAVKKLAASISATPKNTLVGFVIVAIPATYVAVKCGKALVARIQAKNTQPSAEELKADEINCEDSESQKKFDLK